MHYDPGPPGNLSMVRCQGKPSTGAMIESVIFFTSSSTSSSTKTGLSSGAVDQELVVGTSSGAKYGKNCESYSVVVVQAGKLYFWSAFQWEMGRFFRVVQLFGRYVECRYLWRVIWRVPLLETPFLAVVGCNISAYSLETLKFSMVNVSPK